MKRKARLACLQNAAAYPIERAHTTDSSARFRWGIFGIARGGPPSFKSPFGEEKTQQRKKTYNVTPNIARKLHETTV